MPQNPLFIIPFLTGLIFVSAGCIMLKFPPKNINALYGYRTSGSMKSQQRWDFSQKYSAKEMIRLGLILTACCVFGFISKFDNFINLVIALALLILMAAMLLFRVEKAIKDKFGNQ